MPKEQQPDSVAVGSTIRITHDGGCSEGYQHVPAARGVLLVVAAVSSCASAAVATCGIWQLAETVEQLVEHMAPAVDTNAPVATSRRAGAQATEMATMTSGAAAGLPMTPLAMAERAMSPEMVPTTPEASENPIPLGPGPVPRYVWTECTGVFVYIVTTFEHSPRASAASLASNRSGPARFRRAGQMLGDWEVLAITDDWTGLNPGVWLLRGHEICRAELAGNPARIHVDPKPPEKKKKKKRKRRRRRR